MSSRNERKRKREVDTSVEASDRSPDRSSRRESRRSTRRRDHDDSPPQSKSSRSRENFDDDASKNGGGREESLSIEETNKLRAELGLAPLDVDGSAAAANKPDIVLGEGESLFTEDGVSIVHKAARNLTSEKVSDKAKERLETAKQKRQVESKVLKVRRGLAESDSEDESAKAWVERNRKLEEERRKAEEKAKQLDELDEAFGVGGLIEKEQRRMNRPKKTNGNAAAALTSGLVVGHSKQAFMDATDTVLVLQDKGVLDEDEDEVLINPNLIENERHKHNVELRKKKGGNVYNPYEDNESVNEFGELTKKQILDKYDEVLDGDQPKREKFRLDQSGGYDLDKETHEAEMRRKLLMANKKFETLEMARPTLAREFYTEEEMISFRRPKKKKDMNKIRRRKTLKASDLEPEVENGETEAERRLRAEKLAARRGEPLPSSTAADTTTATIASSNGKEKLEDGELAEDDAVPSAPPKSKWKEATGALVDVSKLRELAERKGSKSKKRRGKRSKEVKEEPLEEHMESEEESSDEDNFVGGVDLTGVILEDDAEDELRFALERNRRLKQVKTESTEDGFSHLTGAERVRAMLEAASKVKEECMDVDEAEDGGHRKIVFDVTSEQYKTIGEIPTLGLAGNRQDGVDYSNLLAPDEKDDKETLKKSSKARANDSDSDENNDDLQSKHGKKKSEKSKHTAEDSDDDMDLDDLENLRCEKAESSDEAEYENVLGAEKDVSKGVAAMLKLAGVKGYLEGGNSRPTGDRTLKHLESQRFSRVEQGRYDIEDKTMRKLERMGTTGTGPVRAFPEKVDYKPDVEVSYSDSKGRIMSEKEAFRELSWKFHGKGPGKKQIEKHQAKLEKKERLKKMNSMDTPLGTLSKQRKKQEQLQTPYLILSGTGKDGAPLQKD